MSRITEEKKNEILGVILLALGILSVLNIIYEQTGRFSEIMLGIFQLFMGKGLYIIIVLFFLTGFLLIKNKSIKFGISALGFFLVFWVVLAFLHMGLLPGEEIEQGMRGLGGGVLGASLLFLTRSFFDQMGTYVVLISLGIIGLLLWSEFRFASIFQAIMSPFRLAKKVPSKRKKFKPSQPKKRTPPKKEVKESTLFPAPPTGKYTIPPLNLLQTHENVRAGEPQNQSDLLEKTLSNFSIEAEVINVTHGPRISRYEVHPAPGVKVSRIISLADDLALAMAAPDVRIEAPIPGKAALGIEVPHKAQKIVSLREILGSGDFKDSQSKLTLVLGKDISGEPVVRDLTRMPHLLIAGATGTGKSICLNSFILSILYKATPQQVKMVLIDPKQVELTNFKGLPHLYTPVVSNVKRAAGVLQLMVGEMNQRYELFAQEGVRGIEEFNQLKLMDDPEEVLPFYVIIIDELADLMMIAPGEVEDAICRLAQMARAAGIHLVIATQRPSVDIITGLIKVNIPTRISFFVSSQTDSRTILDTGGAEKLMGDGDMLFSPVGAVKPIRIQAPFVSNYEVKKVVTFIKKQKQPEYAVEPEDLDSGGFVAGGDYKDELFEQAVRLIVENDQASISMLQRRLNIGYTRAARMIDVMEEEGVIGPFAGSKPRKVLLQKKDLDQFFKKDEKK